MRREWNDDHLGDSPEVCVSSRPRKETSDHRIEEKRFWNYILEEVGRFLKIDCDNQEKMVDKAVER